MGLVKGLQLIADAFRLLIWAFEHENQPCAIDVIGVARIWLTEAKVELTGVRAGVVGLSVLALLTSDPFKGSRAALQEVKARYTQSGVK